MSLVFVFILGIVNFTAHRAVVESGHPLLGALRGNTLRTARWGSFALEFIILLAAMLAIEGGQQGWLWLYVFYSMANAGAAWVIVSRRI